MSAHRIASSATVPTFSGAVTSETPSTPSTQLQPGIFGITAGDQKCLSPIVPTHSARALARIRGTCVVLPAQRHESGRPTQSTAKRTPYRDACSRKRATVAASARPARFKQGGLRDAHSRD